MLIEYLGFGGALVLAVGAGTIAHELAHAAVLRAFGVSCTVRWFPDREAAGMLGIQGRLATVTPHAIPPGLSPWRLRVAAIAPIALATPLVLALIGVLPGSSLTGGGYVTAATIGWLACALPSPGDFRVFWRAEGLIDGELTADR